MQATESSSTSAQQNVIKETVSCIKSIVKAEGLKGLYKGFAATLTRDMPSRGVYFFTYKNIRDQLTKYQQLETPSHSAILFAGGMAGAMGWTSIYPFDVIKTHCQVTTLSPDGTALKTLRMREVVVNLYQKYGVRIFFKGLGVTVLRAFPVNAAIFYCYELAINYLHI
jgi:hypothetical protein